MGVIKEQLIELIDQHPNLIAGDDHKVAAKNIRILLKAAFPKIKFSVRCPHYGTIDIGWLDGPTVKEVDDVSSKFQEGHFDGMDDSYKYHGDAWNKAFGGARYIFTRRDFTDAIIQEAIDILAEVYCSKKVTVEDFRQGNLWNCSPVLNGGRMSQTDWGALIYGQLGGMSK